MSLGNWGGQAAANAVGTVSSGTVELSLLAALLLAAITFYQRRLSPHKGFVCAWRFHTGRASCSEYARRIVRRCGALVLWVALPRQFERCRCVHAAQSHRDDRRRPGSRSDRCTDAVDCANLLPDVSCSGVPCDAPCDCSF
ncbi:Putative membrane protein insertion efficiency factor [Xylophilus ampelinus]|nr:membrane protein insertion efficiency factor YidD [Variovorax sp.]VTY36680.1 Putative membrane protein insertion efficiency factor [Xylophilus ampelinus]